MPSATPAAQAGPEHVEEPVAYDGILLSGFGGPEGQDDVIPFLRNVTRGRGIPDERLEEVSTHYRHFGGVSPINEQNRELKAALEGALAAAGVDLPVYWGNRNWAPYLDEALRAGHAAGATRLLAIPTSAYSSYSSCRQYREDWADALEATGLQASMQIDKVRQFFNHPGFLAPFIDGVRATVAEARRGGLRRRRDRGAVRDPLHPHRRRGAIGRTRPARVGTGRRLRGPAPRGGRARDGRGRAGRRRGSSSTSRAPAPPRSRGSSPTSTTRSRRSRGRGRPQGHRDRAARLRERPHGGHVGPRRGGHRDGHRARPAGCAAHRRRASTRSTWARSSTSCRSGSRARPAAERKAVTSIHPWYDVCRPGCCENPRLGFRPAIAGLQP